MEILLKDVRSIGDHMNLHNVNTPPLNYHRIMKNCINPNYIRQFDRAHNFSQKYPLGSIHLLFFIIDNTYTNLAEIKKDGLGTIFFADGIWKILFKYTNNFLDWFQFLDSGGRSDWWKKLQEIPVIDLIKEIDMLINELKNIHPENKKRYGHIDISNLESQRELLLSFLNFLSGLTGWNFKIENWITDGLETYKFTKKIYTGTRSNETFLNIWSKKPLSLAMTEGSIIQYTLENPDKMP